MSSPSSRTRPVIQAPSTSSCMRLRVRRKVDLPQPDGPISACTRFDSNASETFFTAVSFPYIAVSLSVAIRGGVSAMGQVVAPDRQARADAQEEDDQDEHQGGRPGEPVPFLVGAGGVGEHGEGKGRHGLVEVEAQV